VCWAGNVCLVGCTVHPLGRLLNCGSLPGLFDPCAVQSVADSILNTFLSNPQNLLAAGLRRSRISLASLQPPLPYCLGPSVVLSSAREQSSSAFCLPAAPRPAPRPAARLVAAILVRLIMQQTPLGMPTEMSQHYGWCFQLHPTTLTHNAKKGWGVILMGPEGWAGKGLLL
jgi:hypothetical protein